jgi:hypothetical protein
MKKSKSLFVLAFEIMAIIALHTAKIHKKAGEQREETKHRTARQHSPEVKEQHYLLLTIK